MKSAAGDLQKDGFSINCSSKPSNWRFKSDPKQSYCRPLTGGRTTQSIRTSIATVVPYISDMSITGKPDIRRPCAAFNLTAAPVIASKWWPLGYALCRPMTFARVPEASEKVGRIVEAIIINPSASVLESLNDGRAAEYAWWSSYTVTYGCI